jgi:ELWxxDGT repeat protein
LFANTTTAAGTEPWVSNGTTASLLKDVAPGPDFGVGSTSFRGVKAGAVTYFPSNTTYGDGRLWRTDGTPGGTTVVSDLTEVGGYVDTLGALGDIVLMNGGRFIDEGDLYRSDGTATGTFRVGASTAGTASGMFDHHDSTTGNHAFVPSGQVVYFAANEVWRTDPGAGAVRVSDIAPGGLDADPGNFVRGGDGSIYFSANDPAAGREMYRIAPGAAAPQLLGDVLPGPESSAPGRVTAVGNLLYFSARQAASGNTFLWRFNPATGSLGRVRTADGDALARAGRLVQAGGS